MRILMISDFYLPVTGGLETYVDDLASELAQRDHDVHVATLTERAAPSDPRVTAHPVRTLTSRLLRPESADRPFAPPLPDPLARLDLARLLRDVEPDVVHAHSWLGMSLPRRRPPVVWTVHDYALACPRRTLWRYDDRVCDGPSLATCARCGVPVYGAFKSPALAAATAAGRSLLRPDAVLALSEQVRARIGPFVGRPIEVVPGLLREMPAGARPPGLPAGPFALFAGDPRPHKGIDVLLDAWSGDPPGGLPLVVAASRPFERRRPPGVHRCSLRRDQMRAAWEAATMAVVPSLWEEPFGLVAIEALAAGTPVVATTAGALPEIVTDGSDGLLVPPGDPAALRAAVERLAADGDLRRQMAGRAKAAATRFSADAVVPRIESTYRKVAGRLEEVVS